MAARHAPNESAATLQWLVDRLGIDSSDDDQPVRTAWSDVRTSMRLASSSGQLILQSVDWVSDFWLARGAVPTPLLNQIAPSWMPPDEIDEWPAWDAEEAISSLADRATRSNHGRFEAALQAATAPTDAEATAAAALERYVELKAGLVPRVFDVPAILTEHVRVWLASAVGHLLMSAALAPQNDVEAMAREVARRIDLPLQIGLQQGMIDQFGDRHLELLYNARMQPDGRLRIGAVRIGQGEEWRDHWLALGFDIGAEETLVAVQMAATLMRCPSLVLGLELALASSQRPLRTLAVAVMRRWILTLRAMAWLETALPHAWSDVRPKDLCCFALDATKPDWPRRVVAISHRSKDVKPALRDMRVWRAGRFAIDANHVPSWETNVGMIWGLFAATPAIVRVDSPDYRDSVWCRRELELTSYVRDESDFLTRRWIIDLDRSELPRLDAVVDRWNERNPHEPLGRLPEFPPLTEVCSPSPMPAWEARMLRAGAALRQIHRFLPGATPELVNRLALHLQGGVDLPGTAPTNNPDGWRAYGDIFREANETSGAAPDELAVRLPDSYSESDARQDLLMAQRIPDLQAGSPSLRDVLVAMEWLRVEYPQFVERKRGDFLAINCQRLSRDAWAASEEVSLHRGLAAMRSRLPVPLWIIQVADQDVESWPLIGEVPIFTEHVSAQFVWMFETAFDRHDAQRLYAEASGMILSRALAEKCRGAGEPE
jgi:hypothetical protein